MPFITHLSGSSATKAGTPVSWVINLSKLFSCAVPPELSSDIIDKGIVMTGGTAQLKCFDRLITQETGVPAFVAEDPFRCVIKGIGIAIENLDVYSRSIKK